MTDEELERLAKAATPGPWFAGTWLGWCPINHGGVHPGPPTCEYEYKKTEYGCVGADSPGVDIVESTDDGAEMRPEDKAFVAAFNPATALALLERVRKAEASAKHWSDHAGEWQQNGKEYARRAERAEYDLARIANAIGYDGPEDGIAAAAEARVRELEKELKGWEDAAAKFL